MPAVGHDACLVEPLRRLNQLLALLGIAQCRHKFFSLLHLKRSLCCFGNLTAYRKQDAQAHDNPATENEGDITERRVSWRNEQRQEDTANQQVLSAGKMPCRSSLKLARRWRRKNRTHAVLTKQIDQQDEEGIKHPQETKSVDGRQRQTQSNAADQPKEAERGDCADWRLARGVQPRGPAGQEAVAPNRIDDARRR